VVILCAQQRPVVMDPLHSQDDDRWRLRGTIPRLKSSNFPHIEITRILPLNVSSSALRRNNSPGHETIFPLSRRHPETLGN
jgi:hypothetical protein